MQPLLLDEGLPAQVAVALQAVDPVAHAIGDEGAPPRNSGDETNIAWCGDRGAVLVTNDRGKKDKTIFNRLATHHVHAIFVHNDLRSSDPHHLLLALLRAEQEMDTLASRPRGLIQRRLTPSGKLEKRS
jgi:hypothetical protein